MSPLRNLAAPARLREDVGNLQRVYWAAEDVEDVDRVYQGMYQTVEDVNRVSQAVRVYYRGIMGLVQ